MPRAKYLSWLFLISCLWGALLPTLGWMRGCVVTCTRGTETRPVTITTVTTDAACQQLCTGSPANGATPAVASACATLGTPAFTCRGPAQFTPDGSDPSTPVCSCTCAPTAGGTGNSVTVQTTDHCPTVADSSPGCVESCTRRCASPTAPVLAGMRLDPAHQPACVAPTPSATPPPNTQTSNDAPDTAARNAVPLNLSQPIAGISVVSDLGSYIALVYRYAIGLAGTAAVIMVVYGGFLYLLGSAADEVGQGKQIVQDALIGLLLVLGSYLILSTVNPNTLSLKLPNIVPITPKQLPVDIPPTPTNACGNPRQEERVRRPASRGSIQVVNGQPCAYDAECASGICFMHSQTQGICSDLSDNQRCKCIGACCAVMTTPNETGIYLSDTNNHGNGQGTCQNGSVCQFVQDDWKCTRLTYGAGGGTVQTGTPSRPDTNPRPPCVADRDCISLGQGAACIYNSRQSGTLAGRTECSLGREGDQCQCSGAGCDLVDPPNLRIIGDHVPTGNNRGTRRIDCQAGLVCVPFVRQAGTITNPNDLEYFCQLPATLRTNTPPAVTLECRYRCANDATAVQRTPGCTQEGAPGVQECLGVCAGPCGGPGATSCRGVRCVPTTSDYLLTPAPAR